MKKFLSNLYVMIGSIVLTVVATGMLIAILVLPLFPVGSYYGSREYHTMDNYDVKKEEWIKVNLDNTVDFKTKYTNLTNEETREESATLWYYTDGDYLFTLGETKNMTKEQYKDAVEEIEEMSSQEYEALKQMGARLTFVGIAPLYNSSVEGITVYKNKAKIPALITVACVDTALLAFTAASIVFFVKSKKEKK